MSLHFSATINQINTPAGPSRPSRDKAGAFFTALDEGAAEQEPAKRKRKRAPVKRVIGDSDVADNDDETFTSGAEENGDAEDESDDSDVEEVIDGEEVHS